MPTSRPFAYNTGSTVTGTAQLGNLAVVTGTSVNYSQNNLSWFMGPDEDLGYVIGYTADTQTVPGGGTAKIQFWRSKLLTDQSFIDISQYVSSRVGPIQTFASTSSALTWLNSNNFWASYSVVVPSCLLLGTFSGGTINSIVNTIAVQSDGKILVGGDFTEYDGALRYRIIRLNSNGTIDNTFTVGDGFDNLVNVIVVQSDGKILVGGAFQNYDGVSRNRIIRLNADGTIDNTFTIGTGFNSTIYSIEIQSDGKIIVGGAFTVYNSSSVGFLTRLNTDGTRDTSFPSSFPSRIPNSTVRTIKIQSDGKVLVGGSFTSLGPTSVNRIVRYNTDGTDDNSFNIGTGFNSEPIDIELQSDGKILVGGSFTSYSGVSYNCLIRLNTGGTIDNTFSIGTGFENGFDNRVQNISIQSDGKILVGGDFLFYDGNRANRIIRLNSNGTIDNTFNTGGGFNSLISNISLESDGKILVGGVFTTYSGVTSSGLIRLDTNGSICDYTSPPISNWTLNYFGADCGSLACATNNNVIPENVTLYFEVSGSGFFGWDIIRDNSVFNFYYPTDTNTTMSFNAYQDLYFYFNTSGSGSGTLQIKENNSSGRLISQFAINVVD